MMVKVVMLVVVVMVVVEDLASLLLVVEMVAGTVTMDVVIKPLMSVLELEH